MPDEKHSAANWFSSKSTSRVESAEVAAWGQSVKPHPPGRTELGPGLGVHVFVIGLLSDGHAVRVRLVLPV